MRIRENRPPRIGDFTPPPRIYRIRDLKLLPSDAASFEPSQAPLGYKERLRARSSAPESTRKRLRVTERDTAARDTSAEGTAAEGTAAEGTAAEGMAARNKSTEVTAADSDSDCDECPVCLEVLDAATAVLLDCTHVFCATCHEDLSRRASSRQTRAGAIIECPMCRKRAKLTHVV